MFKKKKSVFSHPASKRKMLCLAMGLGFGFLCAYLASSGMEGQDFWWTPLMWSIVINRTLIGFVVFVLGAYNYIPLFKSKYPAWLRGAAIGALFSLGMATGIFMNPEMAEEATMIFWMTIAAGAMYGLIIDSVATALFGDGKKLTEGWQK
ncbi:hypothetical protein GF369_01785 [Candidatus Peregrinibacteria bacterium]|nr:hypothetical protein [Candidatus Peregrinibacteria bacterium]